MNKSEHANGIFSYGSPVLLIFSLNTAFSFLILKIFRKRTLLASLTRNFFQKKFVFFLFGALQIRKHVIIYILFGALAQLVAHNTGSVGVRSSSLLCSTNKQTTSNRMSFCFILKNKGFAHHSAAPRRNIAATSTNTGGCNYFSSHRTEVTPGNLPG